MSRSIFQPEWRTQSRRKRRFYAHYMGWLEKTGYVVVTLLVAGFVGSFFYSVDEWVTADDVPIEGRTVQELTAAAGGTLVRIAVRTGQEVKAGQVLFEFAGARAPVRVLAPQDGTLVLAPELKPGPIAEGQALGALRNYDRLVVRPSLTGKSVANAAVGQRAEISNVRVPGPGNTLLRLNIGDRTLVSRRLAETAVRDALDATLVGKSVVAREDAPLTITKVGDIEVEASIKAVPDGAATVEPDPAHDATLPGKVEEGNPTLTAQLGDLPPEAKRAAVQALRAQLAKSGIVLGNQNYRIEDLLDPRFVVKLTADKPGSATDAIPAATIKRSYEAVVALADERVTESLRQAVRDAEAQGRSVTARVQVRTGARPVAYFLLRRS
ncbi:MAG: biotin/lipoyl-binding protein [Fimbriimonadaceae bacterium]|nr:biotin/lipoyl-binding protein [Fimbriimonadaceae bacterium]